MSNALLIIDMQNDFVRKNGAMPVKGGEQVAKNIAKFIEENSDSLDSVYLTMDSHEEENISSVAFWYDGENNHVKPYTKITLEGVKDGTFRARFFKKYLMEYIEEINKNGKELIAWPKHCITYEDGWFICDEVENALQKTMKTNIYTIEKGQNKYTEHYSAFKAEYPVEWDDRTQLNTDFLDTLNKYDKVYVCGLAADYCVKESLKDMIEYSEELKNKIVVLKDCIAAIGKNFNIDTDDIYSNLLKK